MVAAANAGLLGHGHGAAVSSQSIVRHDAGHGYAPIAHAAVPVAHAYAPVAHAVHAPVAHYAAPVAAYDGHDYYVSTDLGSQYTSGNRSTAFSQISFMSYPPPFTF